MHTTVDPSIPHSLASRDGFITDVAENSHFKGCVTRLSNCELSATSVHAVCAMHDSEAVERQDCGAVKAYRVFNELKFLYDYYDGDDKEFDNNE